MQELRRGLNIWEAIGISVALMAPSMAANINPQATAGSVGRAVPLAFALATVGVLLVAYTFVRLCQQFHHAGSVYGFVGATLGARAGLVAGWALLGTYLLYGVVTSMAAGIFGTSFLDELGIWTKQPTWAPFLVGGLALVAVLLLTMSPVRNATRILLTVEGVTVLLILVVSVVVLVRLLAGTAPQGHHFTWSVFSVPSGTGVSTLFLGAVFGFLSFAGFEAAATLGEESRQPRRDIPRAILGTAIFGGVYFIFLLNSASSVSKSAHTARTLAKDTPERVWLGEVSSVVLQQALADLNVSYRNFFASVTGKRRGRKVAPPRFRSRKDNRQAIRFTKNSRFRVLDNGRLRLPKIGDLRVRWSRDLPAEPSSVTVIRDAAGRYFASFVVQTTDQPLPETDSEVGIDLGLTHFAAMSDGTKVTAPKFLRRAASKLKRLQQDLSRKTKGSNRRKKAVVKVARAHARVAATRRDWQHKLSTAIIRDNQAVYVEDLCVVGLARTRPAKSVHDAGWAAFTGMLEYKAVRYGRTFGRVDRFFPSTKMCSDCGRINDKMALNVRAWDCPCGSHHDRDVNAAMNVLAAGRAESLSDRGAQVRPPAMVAPRGEAVIHPDAACFTRSVEGISVL